MCLELRCIWDEYVFFWGRYLLFVWDETTYIKVWFCWRGMMRCRFRWNGLKQWHAMEGWVDGWMDQWSLLLTVAPPSTPSLKSVVSNVNSLASVFVLTMVEEVSNLHAACIQFEVFHMLHLEPGDTPEIPLDIITCKFHVEPWRVYECTMTQVVYSLFGSPFPLHSEHILIHEGSGALVVKLFAQKETNARTYPALNRYSSKLVYPSFHMKLYLGFAIGTSFYHFFSLIKLVLVTTSTIPNSRKFQHGGGLTPRL